MAKRFWKMFIYLFFVIIVLIFVGISLYNLNYINDTQLTYIGSILGGGITMLGVWYTLDYTNQARIDDQKNRDLELQHRMSMQYMPRVVVLPKTRLEESVKKGPFAYIQNNKIICFLYVKNVGRGDANDVKCEVLVNGDIIFSTELSFINDQVGLKFTQEIDLTRFENLDSINIVVVFYYTDIYEASQYISTNSIKYFIKNKKAINYRVVGDIKKIK